MIEKQTEAHWSENVIIVDAAYIDKVAFNLIVNFERIIGRRIPNADLARWIDCVALDGGIREGEHETSVVLVHAKDKSKLDYFTPADIAADIASKAFKDHLGEFIFTPVTPEDMATEASLVKDTFALALQQKEVKRIMVITDTDVQYDDLREVVDRADEAADGKRITVFTMEPKAGGNFRQEILGYSLMNALGIKADEIKQ
jgi:hypothetical protein